MKASNLFKATSLAILLSANLAQANSNYSLMYESGTFYEDLAPLSQEAIQKFNAGDPDVSVKYSGSSGTSAYVKYNFKQNGKTVSMGAILPKAEATDVLGEIVSYKLAKLLGVADIYAAKTLVKVQDQGLVQFEKAMLELEEAIKDRAGMTYKKQNLKNVLKFIKEEKVLHCAFAPWGHKPEEFEALLDSKHPLRKAITAKGKHPSELSADEIRNFKGKYRTRLEEGDVDPVKLAKQLSNHMVVDIITGQYDRFSGGNLQYFVDDNGSINIGAYDNGGTFEWDKNRFKRYFKIVSRFDRETVKRLEELNEFIHGDRKSFQGLNNLEDLKRELELDNNLKTGQLKNARYVFHQMEEALEKLLGHIHKTCRRKGEKRCKF